MTLKDIRRSLGLLTFFWLYTLAGTTGHAQEAKSVGKKNMLWRVESGNNVVYVLGSVHALPKSMYPLDPAIERAFDSAQELVFELNLDSMSSGGAMLAMMKQATFGGDTVLKQVLSKSTYNLVQKRMKKIGLDINLVSRMRPWMVSLLLSGVDMQASGFEAQHGIDFYFHNKAREEGKEVHGLETLSEQIGFFSMMPLKAQEVMLKQTLEGGDSNKELKLITTAWKRGDAQALEKLLDKYNEDGGDMYESIVYRRNERWIPAIEEYLRSEKTYLVVVGALHLVGDRGVIKLLESRGYKVEQL